MKTNSILSMALCTALSFSLTANAQDDPGTSAPTIENSFTFTPAPGTLDYDTMQYGLTYLTISPNADVVPSVNENCTENVEFLFNGETLVDIAPEYLSFTYVDFHGGFWSGSLNLNPENQLPLEKLQQAGTYEIKFPANLIQVNEVNTPACTLTFTYSEPVEGEVNFESALANTDGDTFYSVYIRMTDPNLSVSITDDFKCELFYNGELEQTLDKSQASAYSNTFTISLPADVTETAQPGEYTFKVFPGSLKAVDKANNVYGFNTSELSYTYTLVAAPAVVAMDPENGSTVEELSKVTLTFNRLMSESTPYDPSIKLQVVQNGEPLDEYEVELMTLEDPYEGYKVLITIDPAITADGEYSIDNIASFVNFKLHADDAWPNYWYYGPIECSFKVEGASAPTIENSFTFTPAPGTLDYDTMQYGLTYLTISPNADVVPSVNENCTENVEFLFNGETLVDIAPEYLSFTYVDFHGGFWSGSLNLNPENQLPLEKLQQAGTYEIKFPANLIQVNEVNTPACTLTFTYSEPVEGEVNFESALANTDGDTFYSVYIRMTDPNLSVSITDDFKCELFYNGELEQTLDKSQASAYSNTFTISLPADVTETAQPGEYTFKVFPGSLKAVDKANNVYGFNTSELSYTYTLVAAPAVVAMDPENGSTVEELSKVTLTFNRLMSESTPYDPSIKLQVVQNGEPLDEYEVELMTLEDPYEGYKVLITIDPAITADGEYSIDNIASFVNFKLHADDAWPNYWYYGPIECSFKVDSNVGTEIINSDDELLNVYNLQGISILKNVTREALRTLPVGIYVVNGRKVYVK